MKLKFRFLPGKFRVCRLPADAPIPAWSQTGPLTSITRTDQELSVVCSEESVPLQQAFEGGWICLKLEAINAANIPTSEKKNGPSLIST
jgi:uncharacterized protein